MTKLKLFALTSGTALLLAAGLADINTVQASPDRVYNFNTGSGAYGRSGSGTYDDSHDRNEYGAGYRDDDHDGDHDDDRDDNDHSGHDGDDDGGQDDDGGHGGDDDD